MIKIFTLILCALFFTLILLIISNIISYYWFIDSKLYTLLITKSDIKSSDFIFPHSTISLYFQSLVTFIIIFMAIFGEKVKHFFIRPSFRYETDKVKIHNESGNSQDSNLTEILLRLMVYNTGRESAIHCTFALDKLYKIGADHNISARIECTPGKFACSTSDTNEVSIFPNSDEFLDIAKITSIRTGNSDSSEQNDMELRILSHACTYTCAVGTEICIVLKFKHSYSQQEKVFILINWCGEDLSEEANLSFKTITQKEFNEINPKGH